MKYGIFTYEERASGKFNVGDHIQSLAAKQYLPRVDELIQRDFLNQLDLNERTAVIMNGWFTHRPENWPPVDLLSPFFISFHLNSSHAEKFLGNPATVDYLKNHAPIGCRDTGTVLSLQKYGIEAYYSSCLTTTLDLKYKTEDRTNEILMVDVLYKDDVKKVYKEDPKRILIDIVKRRYSKRNDREKAIKELIPEDILKSAKYITHSYLNKDYTEDQKFELAEKLLRRYAAARLVITSRIHCALPCLALGTPVIFVAGGELFQDSEMSRLKGTIEHLNVITTEFDNLNAKISEENNVLNAEEIDWNNVKNPTSYLKYTGKLKEACFDFVERVEKDVF